MDYSWSDVTAGQVDADSIINQILMDAVRDDLYHLKEFCYGITDPYTPSAKHDHDGINSKTAVLADGCITGAKLEQYAYGDYKLVGSDNEEETSSTSWTKLKEIYIPRAGNLRIKFDFKAEGANDCYARIYKNGSPIGTQRHKDDTTWTTYSEDISGWAVGDLVQLYAKREDQNPHVRNFRIYSDKYTIETATT